MIGNDNLSNYSLDLNNTIIDSLSYSKCSDEIPIIDTSMIIDGLDKMNVINKEGIVYESIDELKEALKECSKEELQKHMVFAFEEFTKSDTYKDLLKSLQNDYPNIKLYLLHVSIFGWYRDLYIDNLPIEKKNEFSNIQLDNVETVLNKKKGGEQKAINVYTLEEYQEAFKHLKEVEYENVPDGKPFKILNDDDE
jgi:hypothetical protein